MKDISTVTGIEEDSDFPTGYKIVDGQTYVNATLYQDMVQTFQKMVSMTNYPFTPNGEFDNEVNGYQLLDTINKYIEREIVLPRTDQIYTFYLYSDWNMILDSEKILNFPQKALSLLSEGGGVVGFDVIICDGIYCHKIDEVSSFLSSGVVSGYANIDLSAKTIRAFRHDDGIFTEPLSNFDNATIKCLLYIRKIGYINIFD